MSVPVEVLAQQILQLPTVERAKLLNQLISSLDSDRVRDAKWNAVAADRDAQADSDPAMLQPGAAALARIRASLA